MVDKKMEDTEEIEELANNQTFKRYIFMWSGQLFSILGSSVVNFAIAWWVIVLTGSPTLLSIGIFMYTLPMAFLTPIAGVLADRWSRKKIVAIADSLQASTTLWIIALFIFGAANPLVVILIVGLRGIFQAFHVPTVSAITPTMVPKEKISRMNGFNYLFSSLINIIGPVLGALLYEMLHGDIFLILWIDVITFLIALIPLLITKIPVVKRSKIEEKKNSFIFEFKTGIKTIRLIPGILTLLSLSMLLNFLLMPFNVLLSARASLSIGKLLFFGSVYGNTFSISFSTEWFFPNDGNRNICDRLFITHRKHNIHDNHTNSRPTR